MSASPAPLLHITEEEGRTTAQFLRCTRLTEDNADTVAREFAALIAGRTRPQLALDLGAIDYLTSVALGRFIVLNRQVLAAGGRLTLLNLRPLVRQVFTVARLDRIMDIRSDPDAISA